jgi:hypothetical protein
VLTPSAATDIGVILDPYDIHYTLTQSRIPNRMDYLGVTDITAEYLDGFFEGVLGLSSEIIYSRSSTDLIDSSFRLGSPVRVEYNTTIYFSSVSTLVPGKEEVQALLMSGFRGSQKDDYLKVLLTLPQTNLFSSSTDIEFVQSGDTNTTATASGAGQDASGSSNTQKAGIASAAAAGVLILAISGMMMRGRQATSEDTVGKFLDTDGHVTVAGDTYGGASSLDSCSGTNLESRPYEPTDWEDYHEAEAPLGCDTREGARSTSLDDLPESYEDESESDDDSVRLRAL